MGVVDPMGGPRRCAGAALGTGCCARARAFAAGEGAMASATGVDLLCVCFSLSL